MFSCGLSQIEAQKALVKLEIVVLIFDVEFAHTRLTHLHSVPIYN
jgi:hypothetical protein